MAKEQTSMYTPGWDWRSRKDLCISEHWCAAFTHVFLLYYISLLKKNGSAQHCVTKCQSHFLGTNDDRKSLQAPLAREGQTAGVMKRAFGRRPLLFLFTDSRLVSIILYPRHREALTRHHISCSCCAATPGWYIRTYSVRITNRIPLLIKKKKVQGYAI